MPNTLNLQDLDALGQKELIEKGQISPFEITNYYIERIKKLNPTLNAVVYQMFDQALEQVKNRTYPEGPLAGMPFLIKDLNAIKDHSVSSGSRMLKDFIPSENDEIVNRFEQSGLTFLGKTNTPEFGFLPTTEPQLFGPTKNPWNPELSSGGSSGGAAAAVAAGMIPFAHASDGGGSIRIPASCCGLFGFKPSRGLLPYSMYMNHLSVSHSVTRSVRDSAALLDVLKGGTSTEPYPNLENQRSFLSVTKQKVKKLRIAVTPDWDGLVSIDDETREAFNQTVQLLTDLGHEVEEASPVFDFHNFAKQFIKVWVAGGSVIIKHLGHASGNQPGKENLEPLSFNVLKKGEELTALEYEEARVLLQMESKKILSFFDSYDVLLTPVLNTKPPKLESFNESHTDAMFDNMVDYVSFTPIANVTGQPAMSMPLHWTDAGIPIGSHFMGRLGDDETLFKLATQIEEAKPWFHKYKQLD